MDRVAWVVGGVKGLGVMVSKALAEDGYTVVLNYRKSKSAAMQLQREIQGSGGSVLVLEGDVSIPSDVQRMVSLIYKAYKRIDILVCIAGPFIFQSKNVMEYSNDEWDEMLSGNLTSVFYCIREVIPFMREEKYGRIITFGFSEVDQIPAYSGYGAYAAAKTGVASLTKTIAKEEVAHGITVNMICPGDIKDPYKELSIKDVRSQKKFLSPMGRTGSGEDIARVVRFLAHPESDFITGSIIPVTGGYSI